MAAAKPGDTVRVHYKGTLTDGTDYYYQVEHAAGLPLLISAHGNASPGVETIRLGMNDGDPLSAPVEASLSSVTLSPASIPADGVSSALVTVYPMDAAGVPLGSGLQIDVDAGLLLPGGLAGPVKDLGDGRYAFAIRSSTVGSGTVSVTVEGVMLTDAPAVTYLAP